MKKLKLQFINNLGVNKENSIMKYTFLFCPFLQLFNFASGRMGKKQTEFFVDCKTWSDFQDFEKGFSKSVGLLGRNFLSPRSDQFFQSLRKGIEFAFDDLTRIQTEKPQKLTQFKGHSGFLPIDSFMNNVKFEQTKIIFNELNRHAH